MAGYASTAGSAGQKSRAEDSVAFRSDRPPVEDPRFRRCEIGEEIGVEEWEETWQEGLRYQGL